MIGKRKVYSGWVWWWEWKEIFYFYDVPGKALRSDRFVL